MLGVIDRIEEQDGLEWQERITYEFEQLLLREKAAQSDIYHLFQLWNEARGGELFPNENSFVVGNQIPEELSRRIGLADVTPDDPGKYQMLIHGGRTFAGIQGRPIEEFPSRLNVELVASEYWRCKFSGAPFYSEIDQNLNCSTRHYFRGLFPVGEGSKVTKIFLAYRLVSQD